MNRRSAWIFSAMVAGAIAIVVLTIGATVGQFGFGSSSSADSSTAVQQEAGRLDGAGGAGSDRAEDYDDEAQENEFGHEDNDDDDDDREGNDDEDEHGDDDDEGDEEDDD